jgi:flagellar basal-body rod protein FlgB
MSSILGSVLPLHQALDYHLERHSVLTTNLTQLETPGYKAQELVRKSGPFSEVLGVELEASAAGHYGTTGANRSWHLSRDVYSPAGANGNSVSLDRETVKIASNNLRYDAISTMIRGAIDNLDWAARDGR